MIISDGIALQTMQKHLNLDLSNIPFHMRGAIARYLMWGIEPGGFMTAILCNDLKLAVSRADPANIVRLREYAYLMYSIPGNAGGDRERVIEWIEQGGLLGKCKDCGSFNEVQEHFETCPQRVEPHNDN